MTPMALASEIDVVSHALHPRDILGEKIWAGMPEAMKASAIQDWRAERTSVLRKPDEPSPQPDNSGGVLSSECVVTKADIDAIIAAQTQGLTEADKQAMAPIFNALYEPDYPKNVLCMMKKEYLQN